MPVSGYPSCSCGSNHNPPPKPPTFVTGFPLPGPRDSHRSSSRDVRLCPPLTDLSSPSRSASPLLRNTCVRGGWPAARWKQGSCFSIFYTKIPALPAKHWPSKAYSFPLNQQLRMPVPRAIRLYNLKLCSLVLIIVRPRDVICKGGLRGVLSGHLPKSLDPASLSRLSLHRCTQTLPCARAHAPVQPPAPTGWTATTPVFSGPLLLTKSPILFLILTFQVSASENPGLLGDASTCKTTGFCVPFLSPLLWGRPAARQPESHGLCPAFSCYLRLCI